MPDICLLKGDHVSEASDQPIATSLPERGVNISERYDYKRDLITKFDILTIYRSVKPE